MNIELKPEKAWNLVSIVALALMAFVVVYDYVVPSPKPPSANTHKLNKKEANHAIAENTAKLLKARADLTNVVWTEPADSIGPIAMATVSGLARAQGLRLIAFRPQRTVEEEGVQRLPFLVAMEGSFPKILAFLNNLETPTNKLAVNLVQVASADGASDNVNATIGVVAYRRLEGVTKNASTR